MLGSQRKAIGKGSIGAGPMTEIILFLIIPLLPAWIILAVFILGGER
jgi:hypothetical protein